MSAKRNLYSSSKRKIGKYLRLAESQNQLNILIDSASSIPLSKFSANASCLSSRNGDNRIESDRENDDMYLSESSHSDSNLAKSIAEANDKAKLVQEIYNVRSDSNRVKRKKKVPIRYRVELSTDDEVEKFDEVTPVKRKRKFALSSDPYIDAFSTVSKHLTADPQEGYSESLLGPSNSRLELKDSHLVVLMAHVLKSVEDIKEDIKMLSKRQAESTQQLIQIKNMINKGSYQPTSCYIYKLPEGVEIPISSNQDLLTFNMRLEQDENLQKVMVRYLHANCYGKTVQSFIQSIVRKLITRDVAMLYSRLGRKGKMSFEQLSAMYNVVLAAAALKFPTVERDALSDRLGRVLASAMDWDGLRSSRTSNASDCSSKLTET